MIPRYGRTASTSWTTVHFKQIETMEGPLGVTREANQQVHIRGVQGGHQQVSGQTDKLVHANLSLR